MSDNLDSLLTVAIRHGLDAAPLDINFRLIKPWTVLFGPSGSGKTTVLRAIAGFLRPNAGRIEAPSGALFDSLDGTFVPPHKRPVRSADQMAELFPHKNVVRNIAFGCGNAGELVNELMDAFRLDKLATRMPRELSGGETQRVSVVRALASAVAFQGSTRPLLLLDEPLAALDLPTRDEVLTQLRLWTAKHNIPVLSVTHDLGEAFQLEAEVIKIDDGKVIQQGPVAEVLATERQRLLQQLHS